MKKVIMFLMLVICVGFAQARPLMVNEDASLDVEKPFEANYLKQQSETGIPDWVAPAL